MHLEILIEDSSGKALLEHLMPKIINCEGVSYKIREFVGRGHIPKKPSPNIKNKTLLGSIPSYFEGLSYVDALVIVLDSDNNNCQDLLYRLKELEARCQKRPRTVLFRLAIAEMEAWYFGDREALQRAYPDVDQKILDGYKQDSVCDTWERLAEAIGYAKEVKAMKDSIALSGPFKHQLAQKLGPLMNVEKNTSPSFCKLRDGIRRIVSTLA